MDGLEVDEDEVVLGLAGDDGVAEGLEGGGEGGGVGDDLELVFTEGGGLGLFESYGESGDGVVVGTALVAGEDGGVDGVLEVVKGLVAFLVDGAETLAVEDHGAAGATEGFVGGGGNNVGVVEGGGDDVGGDETGNVRHVGEEVGVVLLCDLGKGWVVDQAGVGGCSSNNDFGAVEVSKTGKLFIIDKTGGWVEAVWEGFKVCGNLGNLLGWGLVTGRLLAGRPRGLWFWMAYPWERWPPCGRSRPMMRSCGWHTAEYAYKFAGDPESATPPPLEPFFTPASRETHVGR